MSENMCLESRKTQNVKSKISVGLSQEVALCYPAPGASPETPPAHSELELPNPSLQHSEYFLVFRVIKLIPVTTIPIMLC